VIEDSLGERVPKVVATREVLSFNEQPCPRFAVLRNVHEFVRLRGECFRPNCCVSLCDLIAAEIAKVVYQDASLFVGFAYRSVLPGLFTFDSTARDAPPSTGNATK